MSEFGSSSAPPPASSSSSSLPAAPKTPTVSDVEKFRNAIQKQTSKSAVSSSDSQEQSVSSSTNNQQQNHIPYNLNHQTTAKLVEYEKEKREKEKKDQDEESKEEDQKKKNKNNQENVDDSTADKVDYVESRVNMSQNGCERSLNNKDVRRRLRL